MGKVMIRIILTLILFLFCVSSGFAEEPQDSLYYIEGKINVTFVLDIRTGSGATVIMNDSVETTSDIDGKFRFDNLPPGNYQIQVSAYGCYKEKYDVTIKTASITDFECYLISPDQVNKYLAEIDIREGHPRLMIPGGISPIMFYGQEKWEHKYGVEYENYGCTAPPEKQMAEYNRVIFDYLDNKFGVAWRKDIRKDVVGLRFLSEPPEDINDWRGEPPAPPRGKSVREIIILK